MSPRLFCLIGLVLFPALLVSAEPPSGGSEASKVGTADAVSHPVLSSVGKKRVRDNIQILNGNIRDLQDNLTATHKNLDTIREEMKDLDSLENEHLQLKKKYQAYLDFAARELKKNEKSTEDLEKWEKGAAKSAKTTEDKGLQEKLETARLERADRARWKIDAESKVNRVNELMKSLIDNLRDIRSRRAPLQEQLTEWSTKQKQYETLLSEMTQKKTDMEELLRE